MTSTYKTDMGNGVIIHADGYVKTGKWVFHCGRSHLISRQPLPAPIIALEKSQQVIIGKIPALSEADKQLAISAITRLTSTPGWYYDLQYRTSVLGDNSNIISNVFGLIASVNGKKWAFRVWQAIYSKSESVFNITAEPYDPETYMDHAKYLKEAAASCPGPQ